MDNLVINAVEKNKKSELISNRASANSCESERIVETVGEEQSRALRSKDREASRIVVHARITKRIKKQAAK